MWTCTCRAKSKTKQYHHHSYEATTIDSEERCVYCKHYAVYLPFYSKNGNRELKNITYFLNHVEDLGFTGKTDDSYKVLTYSLDIYHA